MLPLVDHQNFFSYLPTKSQKWGTSLGGQSLPRSGSRAACPVPRSGQHKRAAGEENVWPGRPILASIKPSRCAGGAARQSAHWSPLRGRRCAPERSLDGPLRGRRCAPECTSAYITTLVTVLPG